MSGFFVSKHFTRLSGFGKTGEGITSVVSRERMRVRDELIEWDKREGI